MSDYKIKVGDEVHVSWPALPSGEIRKLFGVVRHIPQATGDSWIIESTQCGREVYYISEPVTIMKPLPPTEGDG